MLICQLTDLHVRPVGMPANRVSETNMFTERAFRAVARLNPRPDAVLITGLAQGGQLGIGMHYGLDVANGKIAERGHG